MIDFKRIKGRGNFYFLRHGESDGNYARIIQGRRDYGLSENGKIQSGEAGLWFKDKKIELVLTSPLNRAKQTAEIVARELGIKDVQACDDLTELDTGVFTGLTLAEIQKTYPDEWDLLRRESWEAVPDAERIEELYHRAERYWALLIGLIKEGKENILSVTHSGILQWLIKTTLGHKAWMPLFPMSNCGISRFILDNSVQSDLYSYYCEWSYLNYVAGSEL